MTIWTRPNSNIPALRLGSIELRDLLSRELDKAHVVLDKWDKSSGGAAPTLSPAFDDPRRPTRTAPRRNQ
jgi:hypothetical protein